MATKILQRRFTPALSTFAPFGAPLFRDIDDVENRMRRFFQQPFAELPSEFAQPLGWTPLLEVTESDKEFLVTAELPGIPPKDIVIEFENGVLTVKGEKLEEKIEEPDKLRMHVWERSYGMFQRALTFPAPVVPEKIVAKFENGVLKVVLPKAAEVKPNVRKIAVETK
jgi:HSP20 family protein